MKFLMTLPLILATQFSRGISISQTSFDSFAFSPLYLNGESTVILKTLRGSFQFNVYISNDLFNRQKICSDKTTGRGTFTYKYDNRYTRSSNTITVEIKIGTKPAIPVSFTSNVASGKNELIVDSQPIISDTVITYLYSDLTIETKNIHYGFNNFNGLYIPEYYHKIKLSDFYINFDPSFVPFFNSNASLVIKNVNGVFNDVSTSNNVEFQLKLIQNEVGYTFALNNDLYVHKETLLLSKTFKNAYVKTNHIYLPRNDMRNQSQYQAYFVLTNFGIDKDTLKHHFEFRALQNIMGDCSNSEYCIERT